MAGTPWTEDEGRFVGRLWAATSDPDEVRRRHAEQYPDRPRTRKALQQAKLDQRWVVEELENRAEDREVPPLPDDLGEVGEGLQEYQTFAGHFVFVVSGRPVAIPHERWDAICRDYSEHGGNMTQAEVARRHGIPRPVLSRCLRAYGQFKASPPTTRERIIDHADDLSPLVAEAIENDENRFLRTLERERDREWRRDYERLKKERLAQDRLVDAACRLAASSPPASVDWTPAVVRSVGDPWTAHVPTTDEHVGKYVWAEESFGRNLDTDEAAARLTNHGPCAADWIAAQPGPCEVAYRTFVGDLFHALMGETEHGTRLDQDTRAARVWNRAMDALLAGLVPVARAAKRVVVKGARGNHDGFLFYLAMYTLRERVRAEGLDNVEVLPRPGHFDHFRVGSSLHVLDHGYAMGSLTGWKARAQAELVAREVGAEDYHGCEQVYTYVGHRHELEVGSHGAHLRMIRLPSLGESDDYETGLRYASTPAAHLFRLDGEGRIRGTAELLRGDFGGGA